MNKHNTRLRAAFLARKRRTKPDFLLIDVSNSFTKLAFASRSRIERASKIATPSLNARRIASILRRRDARTVVVSSVVPKKDREIKRAARGRKIIWLTAKTRLNVRIDYPNPRSIGADRLANAVAVAQLYGSPAIVIDFGTAVTFDIVAPGNAYIGGVIAPGLEAMTNFLYHRTALLPRISLREPRSAVGKSTNQAMLAGAIFGYRGLVREILQANHCRKILEWPSSHRRDGWVCKIDRAQATGSGHRARKPHPGRTPAGWSYGYGIVTQELFVTESRPIAIRL
jgi:pantothenate kinase, type III